MKYNDNFKNALAFYLAGVYQQDHIEAYYIDNINKIVNESFLDQINRDDFSFLVLLIYFSDVETFEKAFGINPLDFEYSLRNFTKKVRVDKFDEKIRSKQIPLEFVYLNNCKNILLDSLNGESISRFVCGYFKKKVPKKITVKEIEDFIIEINRVEDNILP